MPYFRCTQPLCHMARKENKGSLTIPAQDAGRKESIKYKLCNLLWHKEGVLGLQTRKCLM